MPKRRSKRNVESSGTFSQTGPVDPEIKPRDVLHSGTSRCQLQHFTFHGCFSEVAKCKDIETKENIAMKILKKSSYDSQELSRELAMLKKINDLDPENIVCFLEDFEHEGQICLEFEMLDKSLNTLLRERRGKPLSLQEIRPITQQLLTALESLKTVGIIHANIKPHNIMLVNQKDQLFRVKLIDFGSAVPAAEVKRGIIMQPVGYRSPDVILGLPITEAVDMWSLGGVLATLYLGSLPFPQRSQYYLIKTMVETLGQPEDELLSDGTHTLLYFNLNQDSKKPAWRLKTADEYKTATSSPAINFTRSSTVFSCLSDLVMLHPEENMKDKNKFVHLLRLMLHMNPQRRITPNEALIHPFLTLSELDDHEDSSLNDTADPMSISAMVEKAETSDASIHTDEEPVEEDDSAAVDTAVRASAIMSSTDEVSAATESSNKDSAADFSGVEDLPAVCFINEASDGAAGVGLADGDEAASTLASIAASPTAVMTVLYDSRDRDDKDTVTASSSDEASTAPITETDEAEVSRPSDEAHSPPLNAVNTNVSCDGVSDSGSENTWTLKMIKKFFSRMFKALCCCSVDVEQ